MGFKEDFLKIRKEQEEQRGENALLSPIEPGRNPLSPQLPQRQPEIDTGSRFGDDFLRIRKTKEESGQWTKTTSSLLKDIEEFSVQYNTDQKARQSTWQTGEMLDAYRGKTLEMADALLRRIGSTRNYFTDNRAAAEAVYGKGYVGQVLAALDESETNLRGLGTNLNEERDWWQQFDGEDAFKSWQKLQSYTDIQKRPDYAEKSRYVSTYQPGTEKFNAWTGRYTETGFGDMLYDYINGNEIARERQELQDVNAGGSGSVYSTTHSGWRDLPQETVGTFNYIYAIEGPEAAYAYLDLVADKGRTGIENIAFGTLKGSGLSSVSTALMALGEPEAAKAYSDWINTEAARSAQERSGLYGAGAVGGTLMTMLGIGKGIGAIKGLAKLPALAQAIVSGAGTFGLMAGLQGAGDVAVGNITPGEYMKDVGVSALGGAAGGALSSGIGILGRRFLTAHGLTQNALARTVVAGLSGAGFAAGRSGVEELAKYLEYPEDYKPDGAQIAQDVLVAFAFSALSYLTSAGPGAQQTAPEEQFKGEYFDGMTEEQAKAEMRRLAKLYHPDLHPGDTDAAATMARINADYDRYIASIHINNAAEAYRTATTTTGTEAQTAAETYAAEVAYLTEISQSGVLATTEAAEAIQILAAAELGAAASAAANLPATQTGTEPGAVPEVPALTLPSLEEPGPSPAPAGVPSPTEGGKENAAPEGTAELIGTQGQPAAERYSFHDVPVPTYEELIEKPDIPVVDIRRTRTGSFAAERDAFLNSERAQQLYAAPILNRDIGESMFITPGTIKHTFSNLGWEQIELAEHLPEIIENAVLTHAEPSRKAPADRTTGVYTLFGAAQTAEGVQPVKLTVKEYDIEGQAIPQNIRDYLGSGIQPETYASVYDGKVLVLEGIEKEGPSSSAATNTADQAAVYYPSGPSAISVKDLLALVKGDAVKYVPQAQGTPHQSPAATASPQGEANIQNGGLTNGEAERITGTQPSFAGRGGNDAAAGTNALGAPDDLYRGNAGRRADGYGTGGAGAVRGGSKENRALTAQRQKAAQDQPLVSPADFGIENGSESATMRLVPEDSYDEEARGFTEWAYGKGIRDVKIVVGLIQIETGNGPQSVLDVINKDTATLIIRGDSLKRSLTETGRHAVGHFVTGQEQVERFEKVIKSNYKESAWGRMFDIYKAKWSGLTGDYAGMTEREVELYVWEEILEDAYADVDGYGEKASVYHNEAVRALEGTAQDGPAQAAGGAALPAGVQRGAAGTRGPPDRYSYAGRNANGADTEALAEAERLEMQGLDPESIRQETGWFRGDDGLWRYEIDDSGMEYRRQGDMRQMADPEYREYLELWDKVVARLEGTEAEQDRLRELDKRFSGVGRIGAFALRNGTATLPDIIRHDALFRAYPQLRSTRVQFADLQQGVRGEYDRANNIIRLSNELRGAPEDTLIHEIQHAIQRAEGFARGSSTEYWDRRLKNGFDNRTPAELREAERLRREYDIMAAEDPEFVREMEELNANAPSVPRGAFDPVTFEQIEDDPVEWQQFDARVDALGEKYGELKVFDWFHLREQLDRHVAGSGNRTAYDLYRDTAGEIEARDAAARRSMTPEQRRVTRPRLGGEDAVFALDEGEAFSYDENEGLKNIETLTEQDELSLLESVERGDYADRSYIPLRRNTPGILISEVKRYTGDETTVQDLPIISKVGHLRQAMDEDSGSYNPNHRPHNISPGEMISIIKGMDDPAYIVLQENGRYVEVVRYRGEHGGRSSWAVLDFANNENQEQMNGYPGGSYNVLVTQFEPDDLKSYLQSHGNLVIYDKAKDAAKRGSNRLWSSHAFATPFAEAELHSAVAHPDTERLDQPASSAYGKSIARDGEAVKYSVDNDEPEEYHALMERDDVALGEEDQTFTETDRPVDFTWAAIPADSLIVSNDQFGNANPDYPAELQPRDRSRTASQEQIQRMSRGLIPRKLAESPTAQNGAPIVRGDGVVIGGNARSAAILAAYQNGMAGDYEQFIRDRGGRYGIDTEKLPEKPVLVRIAKGADDWAALAQDLNVSSTAAYSATETALADAKRMDGILELLRPNDDGDINTADNNDFIQAFLTKVVPASERGGLMTGNGLLSQAGLERAENAIFAYAYGDPELMARYSESLDNDMKNVTNALMQSAPAAVALRSAIEQGMAYDVPAVQTVLKGLEIYGEAKHLKKTVAEQVAQMDLLDGDNWPAAFIAGFIEKYKRSAKQLRTMFLALYNTVDGYGDPNQQSLFGGEDHDIREALNGAIRRYEQETGREIERPDFWRVGMDPGLGEGYGGGIPAAPDADDARYPEGGPRDAEADGGGLQESEPRELRLGEAFEEAPEAGAPTEAETSPAPATGPPVASAPTPEPSGTKGEIEEPSLPTLEERPEPKKERKPPRPKPPKHEPLPERPYPEGYSSVEEFISSSEARATEAKAERLRNVSKEDFTGTPALDKLGVKIENSVGIYRNTKQLIASDRAAKQIQRETRKAERRLGATEKERNFAAGIAAGVYSAGDIPASMNSEKVMELADYYFAEQAVATDRIRQQRADIGKVLDEKMEELFRDSDDFKPSRAIVMNYRTPERNMLHIFGDERGREINEAIFGPVAVNEAERFRFVNRMHDAVRTFPDKDGKQKKLTKEERAIVQQVIEGRAAAEMVAGMEMHAAVENAAHNIRNGEAAGDAAKEFSLSREEEKLAIRYARWLETEEALRSGKVDAVKVEAAANRYSELFNQFYDAINDFLVAHGYEPIGFIKGYAPHIQPEENHNLLNKAFNALGINNDVTRLPSSIAGLTANYRPNKRWNPYFLQRTGDVTQFDIASAFESYVDYMSDVLYHTDDIMRVRAATRYFRQTYAPEEIKNNLSWASELRYGTTEEKANYLRDQGVIGRATALTPADVDAQMEEYVEKLFGDITKTTKYSDLVTWLDNYANILAGKQSMADRSPESMFGREILNFGNKLIRIFAQANVAGNLSSMINQTAQIPMIQAELGARWTAAAIKDILTGQLRRGEWAGDSDFLTGKKGIEYLVSTPGEMVVTAMFKPLEIMDTFVSTVAVRGKYLKELHAGKSHKEAMKAADKFGTAVMGSRMKGSKPLAFSSKNPIYQMVNIFQIEAFNSWEHIKEDLPRDFRTIEKEQGKAKAARALAGVLVKGLLLAFLMNRLAEKLYGGTPAPFDLLGLTANFIASGNGLTTNAYLETLMDNALEKVSGERLFGTKDEIGEEPFNWEQALEDLGYNVSNDIPFFRNVAGLLGWGDETLPMPDLYGTGKDLVESLKKNGVSWDSGKSLLALLAQLVPGGRQLYKTALGAETIARGGDFSGTGDNEKLKYPTDGDFWSTVQALVFGKYSTEASDAYYAGSETALSANQTKLWRSLTEGGADPRAVYDAIQDYRKIRNDDSLSSYDKGVQERALIAGLELTDDQKLELYRGLTSADSRADKFQAIMDTGLSFSQVMSIYDKYAEIDAEENMKASEQATAFAKWVDEQGYKGSQAEVIKEQLKYWQIIPAEANRYEKLTDAGLESEDAGDLTSALAALQPEQGTETVSNMQKYRLIASWDLSDAEKIAAISTVMGTDMTTEAGNPSAYAKMLNLLDGGVTLDEYLDLNEAGAVDGYVKYQTVNAGRNYGITPETYLDFRERLPGYDADGNGSYTQEEVRNALDSMGGGGGLSLPTLDGGASGTLTNTQKAVLWQIYNKSWKPGKNPYDATIGQWVYDALRAETTQDSPEVPGLSLPSLGW